MLYLEETKPPNSRGGRQDTDQSASILTLMKDRRTGCGPRIACHFATAAVVSLRMRHSLLLVLLLHGHAALDRLTRQRVLCRTTTLLYGIWCLVEIVRNEVREWHFLEFCPPHIRVLPSPIPLWTIRLGMQFFSTSATRRGGCLEWLWLYVIDHTPHPDGCACPR